MKTRIDPTWGFGIFIIVFTVGCNLFMSYMVLTDNPKPMTIAGKIFIMIILLSMQLFFLKEQFDFRKDYFSMVLIDGKGIQASLCGKTWFKADWHEINDVGEFTGDNASYTIPRIYFSKVPLEINETHYKRGHPYNASLQGNGMFMVINPKIRAEILKYISEDQIKQCGRYKDGKKQPDLWGSKRLTRNK